MKQFLVLLLLPLVIPMIHSFGPAPIIDPGIAEGSFMVNEKTITLRHAYAHLHDNAEGLLDRPKELRVLVTDVEVPQNALDGIAFLPVTELAKQGKARGLLFEMAPDDPNQTVVTFLVQPPRPELSLITQTINVTGQQLFKDWSLTNQRVVGGIERQDEREAHTSDIPKMSYSVRFSAPVFNEPAVTADLKGRSALDSPQVRVISAKATALTRGDFTTVRSLSTDRANRRNEAVFAAGNMKATELARQAGAEMKRTIPKVQRVVKRGDRAIVIFPGKQWFSFVRVGGEWKADD